MTFIFCIVAMFFDHPTPITYLIIKVAIEFLYVIEEFYGAEGNYKVK